MKGAKDGIYGMYSMKFEPSIMCLNLNPGPSCLTLGELGPIPL